MSAIYDALNRLNKKDSPPSEEESRAKTLNGNVIVFDDLLKKNAIKTYIIIGVIIIAIIGWLYQLSQDKYEVIPHYTQQQIEPSPEQDDTGATQPAEVAQQELAVPVSVPEEPEIIVSHIKPETTPVMPTPVTEITPDDNTDHLFAPVQRSYEPTTVVQQKISSTPPPLVTDRVQTNLLPSDPMAQHEEESAYIPENNNGDFSIQTQPVIQRIIPAPPPAANIAEQEKESLPKSLASQQEITDFNPVIHILNTELHRAIAQHDNKTGQEKLSELSQLLGKESHYILNLQAYFHLQTGELEKSQTILSKILKNNEEDLEAGLNMIVVLAKQGELKQAAKQTRFLLNYYPANPSLLHFKQQLRE